MRALLALLTTLPMLHLSLVAGDLACASHEAGGAGMQGMVMAPAAPAPQRSAGSPYTAAHRDAAGAADAAGDCATPSQARCCDAMASCGVSTNVCAIERPIAQDLPAAGTPTLPSAVLESVLTAPEPPPPKA